MKNERELFEGVMKSKCIFDLDYVQYHDVSNKYVIQGGLSGDDFKIALDASHVVNTAWLSWQAATQRDGFKFVPVGELSRKVQNIRALNTGEYASDEIEENVCGIEAMIGVIND